MFALPSWTQWLSRSLPFCVNCVLCMWTEKDPHVQYTKGRREETRRHLRATETNFNLSVDFHTQHMKDHSYIFFI